MAGEALAGECTWRVTWIASVKGPLCLACWDGKTFLKWNSLSSSVVEGLAGISFPGCFFQGLLLFVAVRAIHQVFSAVHKIGQDTKYIQPAFSSLHLPQEVLSKCPSLIPFPLIKILCELVIRVIAVDGY